MARRNRRQMVNHETTVESSSRGISAAGESIGAILVFILIILGVLAMVVVTVTNFLWDAAVMVLGEHGASVLALAIPITFAVILLYGAFGVVGAGVLRLWAWAQQARLQARYVQPGVDGLFPVAKSFMDSAEGSIAAVQIAMADKRAQWTVGDVPLHLTHSPRYNNSADMAAVEPAQLTATAPHPQGFYQLYSSGQLPDNGFLMGYNLIDGEAVTADWTKLYSALIGGRSGSGKSTLIRSILAQSALQGGRFIVVDPHYGAGDESLGASLQPLRGLMLTDVAGNDQQMIDTLAMVRDIGRRRLSGRDHDKTPIILVVDELTALLQRSSAAQPLIDTLGEISQETRKVGLYALCIGQNFNGRVMDTTVRNSFVSYVSCRARSDVARIMAGDLEFGKAAAGLALGQAVWMTPSGETLSFAVPNTTMADLEMVAQHAQNSAFGNNGAMVPTYALPAGTSGSTLVPNGFHNGGTTMEPEPRWNHDGTTMEPPVEPAKLARIETMIADGVSISEIIRTVFGVHNKGRAWQQARAKLQLAIDYLNSEGENGR